MCESAIETGTDINDNSHKALIHLLNICIGLVSAGVKGQSDADANADADADATAGHFFQSTGSSRLPGAYPAGDLCANIAQICWSRFTIGACQRLNARTQPSPFRVLVSICPASQPASCIPASYLLSLIKSTPLPERERKWVTVRVRRFLH